MGLRVRVRVRVRVKVRVEGKARARVRVRWKVVYQSVMEKTVGLAVPRSRAGSSPPVTKVALRMPPSKLVPFCPRSG